MSDLTREQIESFRDRVQWHPEVVDTVRALCTMALRALDAGWQPMSTAPRDGTRVLVACIGLYRQTAETAYFDLEFASWETEDGRTIEPDAWMPLPLPCAEVPHG